MSDHVKQAAVKRLPPVSFYALCLPNRRKESFVSDTITDRKMTANPHPTCSVSVSLPKSNENIAPNTASKLKRIAAAEGGVYF